MPDATLYTSEESLRRDSPSTSCSEFVCSPESSELNDALKAAEREFLELGLGRVLSLWTGAMAVLSWSPRGAERRRSCTAVMAT